jgi:hypothetical protein
MRKEDNVMQARDINWDFILVGALVVGFAVWAAFSWELFW